MADDCKYKFLSEPDDALKCLICLDVADEPWQHVDCGRLFCKECLDKHGRNKPCPNCRIDKPQYFLDSKSDPSWASPAKESSELVEKNYCSLQMRYYFQPGNRQFPFRQM